MEKVWSLGLKDAVRAMKKNSESSTTMNALTDLEKSLVAKSMQPKNDAVVRPMDTWN